MKKVQLAVAVLAAGMFASGAAWADDQHAKNAKNATGQNTPQETTADVTHETPSKTTKYTTVTAIGKVHAFTAGKSLEVATPRGGHKTFDLNGKDTTVNGAENIKVGEMVRVKQRKENGKTIVDVEPYTSASRTRRVQHPRTDTTGSATPETK